MKKQLRKIALAVVFSMAATMFAPAGQAMAAQKTFTYAEQNSGDKVTTLFMDCNEKVDLKFLGISNWKSYRYKWASSNEKVAVVDTAGVITALSEGTTTIKLLVGDGKEYTSTGVMVTVGKTQEVSIGTAAKEEIKSCTLEVGKSMMLKANGIKDDVGDRYTFEWSSTDTSVVKVSDSGQLTAVAPGLAVVQLRVTKAFSGKVMEATPIAVLVDTKATPTPLPTATPKPTVAPTAAPTAAPTTAPGVTVTPTPTPIATNGNYTVAVTSDRSITLTFKNKVAYTEQDVEFNQIYEYGTEDFPIQLSVESVQLDATGKVMTIRTVDPMETNRYKVKVGSTDAGTTFTVTIGEPNRMEVGYSCLGQQGIAYAYSNSVGIDVPVTLDYKLFYNDIDVTESYENLGYTSYVLLSPLNSEHVMQAGDQMYFYAKQNASVEGTFTYYTNSGKEIVLKDKETIQVRELSDYRITGVVKWTIIKKDSTTAIDWNSTNNSVVAGEEGYKIVALLADSYGNYYSTDERGVDRSKNIFSTSDTETLFALKGYTFEFNPSNDTNFYVDGAGNLYSYAEQSRAGVYVTLFNPGEYTNGERNVGTWYFTILAESKLNSVEIAETNIVLLTQAVNNEERFCETDIKVKLLDQYGNPWKGTPNLEITSSVAALNNGAGDVATISPGTVDGEWILHINAKSIKYYSANTNSVSFTVADYDTKKRDSILVYLKNPASNNSDNIVIGSWNVGMKEDTITYGNGNQNDIGAKAKIEIYQVSKNGGYNVGLFGSNGATDENGVATRIVLQRSADYAFTPTTCAAGDIYVLVMGPDGKMVDVVDSPYELGVYQETDGTVSVMVTPQNSEKLVGLAEGKYTVKVTKINSIKNNYVYKNTKTTVFTVVDNTKDVTVIGENNYRRTTRTVTGETDEAWKEIVLELFDFALGGAAWTDVKSTMVTNVECISWGNNGAYKVTSIEFEVPGDGADKISYKKTVKVNQTVYTGANN